VSCSDFFFFHFTADKLGYIHEKRTQVNKRRRNDDIYKDLDDDEEVEARSNKKIGKFKSFMSSFIINLLKPIIIQLILGKPGHLMT